MLFIQEKKKERELHLWEIFPIKTESIYSESDCVKFWMREESSSVANPGGKKKLGEHCLPIAELK